MFVRNATLGTAAALGMLASGPSGDCPRRGLSPSALSCGDLDAFLAVSEDREAAGAAIASLRERGPTGLADFLGTWESALEHRRSLAPDDPALADPVWARIAEATDRIGAQRDNLAARLYWYTDLEQAQAAARETGRPILSLRLLGRLDEELSCANSRFMRTALYANREVSSILRDRFILHWQSVRPVPKITIDFGDGRRVERTVTGNSLHYVLDAEGRPIDALPGLYGPGAFRAWLERTHGLHAQLQALPPGLAEVMLADHHAWRVADIASDWAADLEAAGHPALPGLGRLAAGQGEFPDALAAAELTVTKAMVESPVIAAVRSVSSLEAATPDAAWTDLARLHLDEARLDQSSLDVMARKTGCGPAAAERFERLIAEDAVRNEYLHHRRIHEWLAAGNRSGHELLTERIYAEIFLTPAADPWLGLVDPAEYAALDGNGLFTPPCGRD